MYKKHCSKRDGSRGMSLVELLLVMAILSVVMMAVMSLYVPAHQSTVTQTQVSDVQSNLRLALKVMTQDLLRAGFLVPDNPVVFPDPPRNYYNTASRGTTDNTDFIIRTRAVTSDFGRVSTAADQGAVFRLVLAEPEMAGNFEANDKVRLFEPITATEIIAGTGAHTARAYNVEDVFQDSTTGWIEISKGALTLPDLVEETIVLRYSSVDQPTQQTIRYRLNNGALERIINDSPQILARNVDSVYFDYEPFTPEGRVNHIDIRLVGKTKAIRNDVISGEKSRAVETSVKLRNVF